MKNTTTGLKWLLVRIRRRIPALALLVIFSVGSSLSGVFFALGTKGVIDAAVAGNRNDFLQACVKQACVILVLLLCLTLVRYLKERLTVTLDQDWKRSILHDLFESEYQAVAKFHSSEILNRLNNDVRILNDGIINLLPNLCSMFTKLGAAFGVLIALTPWFALVLLMAGVVVILITGFLRRRLKGMHKKVSEANGRVSGILQESLEKLLVIQAMDVTTEMERRVKGRLDERLKLYKKRMKISLTANTCVSIMFYGAGFASLVFCSHGLLSGTMTFGMLTAVNQLVGQIQSPLVSLSGVIPQFIAMSAALERLYELKELPKTTEPCDEPANQLYDRMDGIAAENLTFAYDRDYILNNAEFSLQKGAFCVITGPSGIGKSTLLKLLLGIFKPEQGDLYFQCGNEKISINCSTRRMFAYVPQGNLLFSGTIRENLLVIRPEATQEEIDRAVYISVMDAYLPQLPDGLDTVLGESGAGLSEGQAQRLAIARAILGGAPILLLDECTSALDVATEALVLERLREQKDKTYIAVTHRPVAKEICDINIKMSNGMIQIEHLHSDLTED